MFKLEWKIRDDPFLSSINFEPYDPKVIVNNVNKYEPSFHIELLFSAKKVPKYSNLKKLIFMPNECNMNQDIVLRV